MSESNSRLPPRWRSIVALLVIIVSLLLQWSWIWGALFLVWSANDLRRGHTYLLEDIPRSESPVLYWIVVLMWVVSGLLSLLYCASCSRDWAGYW